MALFLELESTKSEIISVRKDAISSVMDLGKNGVSVRISGLPLIIPVNRPYPEFMKWLEENLK